MSLLRTWAACLAGGLSWHAAVGFPACCGEEWFVAAMAQLNREVGKTRCGRVQVRGTPWKGPLTLFPYIYISPVYTVAPE